jgi:hypothetical protein
MIIGVGDGDFWSVLFGCIGGGEWDVERSFIKETVVGGQRGEIEER